jgi:hypothetical protein
MTMTETTYYLSAIVGADPEALEVRTKAYSTDNFQALLAENPAAITCSMSEGVTPAQLLEAFRRLRLPAKSRSAGRKQTFVCYAREAGADAPHRLRSVDAAELPAMLTQLRRPGVVVAFVSEASVAACPSPSAVDVLVSDAMAPPPGAPPRSRNPDAANRLAVHAARDRMLATVGSYGSEDLASAWGSTTSNASQLAADQRKAGKVFGVRVGREWRYPQFQFDAARKPFAEMKAIVGALSPDERGWDRLQWFLEPHEALHGKTPLEVWPQDRSKVVEAARTEHWNARD